MKEESKEKSPHSPEDTASRSKTAEREEEILKFWKEKEIFEKSLNREENPEGNFVFYDGPPFATGEPHYGHVLQGVIKDVVPRYKTMRGYKVMRTWGWDCHGLPIENLVEKELGLKSKKEIENYGVEKFNKAARESVLRYEKVWKDFVPRTGRWVDMDNPYKTMDSSYTESVWWSFKTLYDKGLVYEGFKVMPYCPHCGTTLSNFEVNLGYKDIADISVYVQFELKDEPGTFLIAWTTTPWTLPGNVALAINKDIEYVKYNWAGKNFIVAKSKFSPVSEYPGHIVSEFVGKNLIGLEYKPLFDYYSKDENLKNRENGWKVVAGDFVNTEDGTGIVHIAPAFGADDYELSQKENLPFVQHVDLEGRVKVDIENLAGMLVKPKSDDEKERLATDIEVIKYLQEKGNFFDKKKINHSYPHCWRCDTPLLNYATSSWFVKVTDLKDKIVKLNSNVKWIPEDIRDGRFGKWLLGARDWAVSRSRFWGAPLPVWQKANGEKIVIGSISDLKKYTKKSGNKYFVMRHGETEGNIKKVLSPTADVSDPLTKNGIEQVSEAAENLLSKKIDLIVCSPIERAYDTAKIIAGVLNISLESIVTDNRLVEWNVGSKYSGKPVEEFFSDRNQNGDRYGFKTSDGESYKEVNNRAGDFIYEIEKKYSNKNILIITHGAVARILQIISNGFSYNSLREQSKHFKNFANAEVRDLDFVSLPHNENYELDLHKPYIDEVELVDENGGKMIRVKEVFDTWYDSGSVPFASIHYPFENKEEFEKKGNALFPADFIAEGLDQTRGWFYTLLVLGAGLFDKSPYKNVTVTGIVLAEDGQKMSKRLKNYPDPRIMLDKYGADSLRYYLVSSPVVHAEDLLFSEKGLDEVHKKIILRLENVLSFYEMYADKNLPMSDIGKNENVLDNWIISRLNEMGRMITSHLDNYELDKASRPILDFIDDFSTWYIRRSRERFKSENLEDKNMALITTRFVLLELAKYMAPFTPFFSEYLYRKLKEEKDLNSVHLDSWPKLEKVDENILKNMEEVRRLVSLGLEKRNTANIKVRQPLFELKIKNYELGDEYTRLIQEEVNVKKVVKDENMEREVWLDTIITPELKREGDIREFIRTVQDLRKEKNMTPDQKIVLQVETSEDGENFIKESKVEISKPTNISDFVFVSNSGKEINIENITFKLDVSQT